MSLYASIAKGYKAGGYNIIVNEMSSQLVNLEYDKEKLWNYEIGIKYFNPDRNFNLNAAAFFIDWKDQQIFVMGMMGPGIKNAGDAHSLGGEMDLRWEFIPGLTYLLSAGYSHAEYYHHETKAGLLWLRNLPVIVDLCTSKQSKHPGFVHLRFLRR